MFGLGLPELIIILVILLLLFGATRLPKLAKSLGQSAGELKKGFEGGLLEDKKDTKNSHSHNSNSHNTHNPHQN